MVKQLDFRLLSPAAREEIFRVAGITDKDREWLRARSSPVVLCEFADRYKVSRLQQKKAHAILNSICVWSGYTPLETEKTMTKQMFLDSQVPTIASDFSLADCSMEVAKLYITWLIDFCLMQDIPCGEPMWKLAEDIPKYVYMAAVHKRCAVCGKKADLHHVQSVGSQGYRDKINHIGLDALPLCRVHHTESHKIGQESFMGKYHLQPVKIDKKIAKLYRLSIKGE